MKLLYKEIEVNMERVQSRNTIIVPAWEVPIVQSVHPATEEKRDIVVERDTLSVSAEYSRLQSAYGAEREEGGAVGHPYVESVYGGGAIGVGNLKRAMQSSVLPSSTPVTPTARSPEIRKDLLLSIAQDKDSDDLIGDMPEVTLDEDSIT